MEITGPILQATLFSGYGTTIRKLQTTNPTVPIWCPIIYTSFDPYEASGWQVTVTGACMKKAVTS
jgi:hypothetical protein